MLRTIVLAILIVEIGIPIVLWLISLAFEDRTVGCIIFGLAIIIILSIFAQSHCVNYQFLKKEWFMQSTLFFFQKELFFLSSSSSTRHIIYHYEIKSIILSILRHVYYHELNNYPLSTFYVSYLIFYSELTQHFVASFDFIT